MDFSGNQGLGLGGRDEHFTPTLLHATAVPHLGMTQADLPYVALRLGSHAFFFPAGASPTLQERRAVWV